ncbi:HTTM domain-containing protein [Natronobacterium texcoconense]|uniref:Vitamin K-dependent gamma-carboxylase n=1 Tax=Natronobacterium texcoconense TaxID=1095778 RepID=A0A1H1BSQ4_NATTX|nr:HTTM domain-containing protein [Natronobacterium texcoconense]SDQ54939.1 Vitamin K-dependent gamma-carboxylase [Natronobacterium texcoconense]
MGKISRRLTVLSARIRERLANPTYLASASVRIDTRSLAAFRIAAGLLIVADVLLRARNFRFMYTEEGAVPQSLAMEASADGAFSVYYFTTSSTAIAALFVLTALVGIQLAIGYRTRIATVVAFLLVISLDHHNPLVLSYADVLFRFLLFWAIFLPLGERWSIDAVHADGPSRDGVTSVASAAILAQIVFMYFLNGYHKTESDLWISGEATPLIMGLDNTTFLLGDFMRNFPTMLQYGGLTWYYMLLFSWLLVLLGGRARTALVAMFVGGHASFAITVRIGAFPYVAIAGLLLFLQAGFWEDVKTIARYASIERLRPVDARGSLERLARSVPVFQLSTPVPGWFTRSVYGVALAIAVVSVLIVPALTHMPLAEFVDEEDGPADRIEQRAEIVGVDQPDWSVFAPHPRTSDQYYVFPAQTQDGGQFDVYNDRELTYDRPYEELQKQFDTYRERFYMSSVRSSDTVAASLAEHLCSNWGADRNATITHVNVYYVVEDVTLESIDDPTDRDRDKERVYEHGCGDHEPREIAPPE